MSKRPTLKDELKKKFGSPRACIKALGLDESLLDAPRLAFDGANQMKPNRLQAILVSSAARIFNPQLALDAKGVNYAKLFEGVTSKTLKGRKPTIVADAKKMLKGKTLAKDASVEGLAHLLDQFEKVKEPTELDESVSEPQHKAMEAAAHGHSTLGIPKDVGKEFADADKGKTFDEELDELFKKHGKDSKVIRDAMASMETRGAEDEEAEEALDKDDDEVEVEVEEDESEEAKEERERKEAEDKAAKDKAAKDKAAKDRAARDRRGAMDKNSITQDQVDKIVASAIATERKRNGKTQEAREFVRPYVGDLPMALDSAEAVYRAAATALDIEDADSVHASALPTLIKRLGRKAGAQNLNNGGGDLANDSASIGDAYDYFPEAARIQ